MREDTKDLLAITILITFAIILLMFVLATASQFFLILVVILGSIGLISWAIMRVIGLDK